jgi:hypothetical protein
MAMAAGKTIDALINRSTLQWGPREIFRQQCTQKIHLLVFHPPNPTIYVLCICIVYTVSTIMCFHCESKKYVHT